MAEVVFGLYKVEILFREKGMGQVSKIARKVPVIQDGALIFETRANVAYMYPLSVIQEASWEPYKE